MSAAGDEIDRRVAERVSREVRENRQLREQLGFATREIHPMERKCEGLGGHSLGPVFYAVDRGSKIKDWIGTGKRTYRLICPDCYEHHVTSKED